MYVSLSTTELPIENIMENKFYNLKPKMFTITNFLKILRKNNEK